MQMVWLMLMFVMINGLRHRLKSSSQYLKLLGQSKDNCHWLDFMQEKSNNTRDDLVEWKGNNCDVTVCKTRKEVLDEAVCFAFNVEQKFKQSEALYYSQTLRFYNQTVDVDQYQTDYIAQYLFMVLPSQLKYYREDFRVRMVSVAVPVSKSEKAFDMSRCPLDLIGENLEKKEEEGGDKYDCQIKVDLKRVKIKQKNKKQDELSWLEYKQKESNYDSMFFE